MSWQLIVLVVQVALGGGLFLGGMRKAIHEYNTEGPIWGGIAMMAVGALLLLLVHPMISWIAPAKPGL